jgi:polyhydroxyalkanoate synthesis repressor PhaR
MRLIKRYDNRKLYDTTAKSYISMDDITRAIREGDTVRVVENSSGDDITAKVLTQIILEEGKNSGSPISEATLHELIRWGESVVEKGVGPIRDGLDKLVHNSIQRLLPLSSNSEVDMLRVRIGELEGALAQLLQKLEQQQN